MTTMACQTEGSPEDQLRAAGLKATAQRALVLEIIRGSGQHMDAEAIHQEAQAQEADISLATVYRTLNSLKRAGLIEQRYLARDHTREKYEAAGGSEHYHFTCLGCGAVFEFETPLIQQLQKELQHEWGWVLNRACMCYEGFCAACVAKGIAAPRVVNDGATQAHGRHDT
jgi:Fe2+ or Zn2+ uptake regulation protein